MFDKLDDLLLRYEDIMNELNEPNDFCKRKSENNAEWRTETRTEVKIFPSYRRTNREFFRFIIYKPFFCAIL